MNEIPLSNRYRLMRAIKKLPNLVGYWPLNEVEGAVARNYAPANLGSLNGAITGATVGQPGKVGRAYNFDGVNDVITVTHNSLLNITDATFLFLFNLTNLHQNGSSTKFLLKKDTPFICDLNANGTIEFAINNGGWDAIFTTKDSWAANTWFCVVLVNDADVGRTFYINGVSENTGSGITPVTSSGDLFLMGEDVGGTNSFEGLMQHVALFDVALSSAQLLKLAQIAGLA